MKRGLRSDTHAPDALWDTHQRELREVPDVISFWEGAHVIRQEQFDFRTSGAWWDAVERSGRTLFVSREYEHLILGIGVNEGRPSITHMRVPHPSGMAWDPARKRLHVACTRNPNQLLTLGRGGRGEGDAPSKSKRASARVLMPAALRYLPGRLYLHDLAMIGKRLYGNAVGLNAIVRLDGPDPTQPVWWPRCVECDGIPDFSKNYIQLNSIAAGPSLARSYFSASSISRSRRRPGHLNYAVKGRGTIFSGRSREPIATGLTRPHSARLHQGRIWVDNSGYGELGWIEDGKYTSFVSLPGWTRGLHFVEDLAFVGTSRVIPRFRGYAPGLEVDRSECAIHAVDVPSGRILGSLAWPSGNQIFAIESAPRKEITGLPFTPRRALKDSSIKEMFYFCCAEQ